MRVARQLVIIFGFLAAAILLVSFLASEQALESGWLAQWPACAARRAGGSCGLCGMSHAFLAISHGRWGEARRLNPYAPWLYAGFVAMALSALMLASRRLARGR